jgi:AcrR family transcriptional regulator
VHATSIDAIAVAAGVGKGTVFRRFGDRSSLVLAVLDRSERAFQDAILHGPPPLGPGAPPAERLLAFGRAMLSRMEHDGELLREVEMLLAGHWQRSPPYAVMRLHVRTLLLEASPGCDAEYLADALLATLSPASFEHQRHVRGLPLERLQLGFAELVAGLLDGGSGQRPEPDPAAHAAERLDL